MGSTGMGGQLPLPILSHFPIFSFVLVRSVSLADPILTHRLRGFRFPVPSRFVAVEDCDARASPFRLQEARG